MRRSTCKLEPLPRGSGMQFDADCREEVLDKNWQRLVLTHLEEKQHLGVLTGAPLTDVKITLIAGRAHLKHTEGGDFRQATYRAVRQGLMMAAQIHKTQLLEPWYAFRLELPGGTRGPRHERHSADGRQLRPAPDRPGRPDHHPAPERPRPPPCAATPWTWWATRGAGDI